MDTFGWSPRMFWRSTPCEFFAMIEARKAANAEIDRRSKQR